MIVRNAVKVDISTANMRQHRGAGRLQKGPGPMSVQAPRRNAAVLHRNIQQWLIKQAPHPTTTLASKPF